MNIADGKFYEFQRYCTHQDFPLEFSPPPCPKDKVLTCLLHGSQFDIKSGKSLGPLNIRDLKIYDTIIKENNEIYVVIND